jgi:hypothetical protein
MVPEGRVSVAQAAVICQVAPATIYTWLARGKFTRNRDGIDLEALLIWFDRERDVSKARAGRLSAHHRYQRQHFTGSDGCATPKVNASLR